MSEEKLEIIKGSDNVYRDFGDPDAELKRVKAQCAAEIIRIMDRKKLSGVDAEKLTGIDEGDFSRIRNANLSRITSDRLIKILASLDRGLNASFATLGKYHKRKNPITFAAKKGSVKEIEAA